MNKRLLDYWRRIWRSLCTHSQPTRFTLFLYNKQLRAWDPSLERVPHGAKPRIPDINVKFAFRLSTLSLLPRIRYPSRLSSPREKLSLLLSLEVTVSPRSVPFPLPFSLSSLPCPIFSDLFLSLNYSLLFSFVFLLPRNFNSFRSLSFEHFYIHFHHFKVSRLSFFSFVLFVSPWSPFLFLPNLAHFAPVRNNKRSTREVTTPRFRRNRADLRPGSEKAIWANRTPPAEEGEGPADNERSYGR